MSTADSAWEKRVDELWKAIDAYEPEEFVARLDTLVSDLPLDSAIGLFERGSAQDSTGHPDLAVPLYRAALETGLSGQRRRRAIIQMASSLRSLGDAKQAVDLLTAELAQASDELDSAVCAFLALALVDLGREREASPSASPHCRSACPDTTARSRATPELSRIRSHSERRQVHSHSPPARESLRSSIFDIRSGRCGAEYQTVSGIRF
jgi:hypothetical protein